MLHDGHFDMVLEFSSSAAAAAFGIEGAEDDSAKAIKLHRKRRVPAEQYLDLSNSGVSLLRSAVSQLFETRESKDAFGVRKGLGELERATKVSIAAGAAVAHSALLNKLDTSLTMLQKAQGDPAEILHNILWRRDLYDRVPQLQKLESTTAALERLEQFTAAYGACNIDEDSYPGLIRELLAHFRETAQALGEEDLDELRCAPELEPIFERALSGGHTLRSPRLSPGRLSKPPPEQESTATHVLQPYCNRDGTG